MDSRPISFEVAQTGIAPNDGKGRMGGGVPENGRQPGAKRPMAQCAGKTENVMQKIKNFTSNTR